MDWNVLGHSHNQRNFRLNGFLNGLCCLVAGHIDGRGVGLSSLLGLKIEISPICGDCIL